MTPETQMDPRLQEMLDHHEIRKTLYEYCHGLDHMDQTRMASVYAEDSWDEHGPFKSTGQAFAQNVLQVMKDGASAIDTHMLGQSLIQVNGDEAGADTYFLATSIKREEDGSEVILQLSGRYVDTFVREDGRWKVKRRICVRDWGVSLPIIEDWTRNMGFVQARRSQEDPSYAVLGVTHSGLPKQD